MLKFTLSYCLLLAQGKSWLRSFVEWTERSEPGMKQLSRVKEILSGELFDFKPNIYSNFCCFCSRTEIGMGQSGEADCVPAVSLCKLMDQLTFSRFNEYPVLLESLKFIEASCSRLNGCKFPSSPLHRIQLYRIASLMNIWCRLLKVFPGVFLFDFHWKSFAVAQVIEELSF